MPRQTPERKRTELSDYVTNCRKRLSPADVGLPATRRRRTAGLRREEVATLAGVGLTWYTWFEQGRDIQVSEDFLLNVAKALQLDDAECHHLFLLAHRRPPPAEACHWPSVSPRIQQLLDDLSKRPAYVCNLQWNVIAWNTRADRLFGFSKRERNHRNLICMVFTDVKLKSRLQNWHDDAKHMLAQFRCDLATAPDDPALLRLTDEMKHQSSDFREWFKQQSPKDSHRGVTCIANNKGRVLNFAHEVLTVDEFRHLNMVVYFELRIPSSNPV